MAAKRKKQPSSDIGDSMADGLLGPFGDVLVFVHGYNNSAEEIRKRHETLQEGLSGEGWGGIVVSNAKRLGTAPRAGRVGLTDKKHPKTVNVDCSDYFRNLDPKFESEWRKLSAPVAARMRPAG